MIYGFFTWCENPGIRQVTGQDNGHCHLLQLGCPSKYHEAMTVRTECGNGTKFWLMNTPRTFKVDTSY